MAIADGAHHVAAIITEVLRRLLAHDVSLIRHQGDEGNEGPANDRPQSPASQTLLLQDRGDAGAGDAHGASISVAYI